MVNSETKSTSAPRPQKTIPVRRKPAAVASSPAKTVKNEKDSGCATSQKIFEIRNMGISFRVSMLNKS
ncbi:hypothetical protein BHMPCIPO_00358 [Ensifer sesbaniae]|nr:hypothetical protein [Ensifer sesbaniae]